MKRLVSIIVILCFILVPFASFAHNGKTDGNGGHYYRIDIDCDDQVEGDWLGYHYHQGDNCGYQLEFDKGFPYCEDNNDDRNKAFEEYYPFDISINYDFGKWVQVQFDSCSSPIVTIAPTESPIVTIAPTESPIVTIAPTESPIVTVVPTESPVDTSTPIDTESPVVTSTPVVTIAPTESPIDSQGLPQTGDGDIELILCCIGIILMLAGALLLFTKPGK